jgi:hypothetical protein
MKFIKLFESYTSQKEIENISNQIIKLIAEETYETTKGLWAINDEDPQLRSVFHNLIGVNNVLKKIETNEIYEMIDFVDNFKLNIVPQRWDIDGRKSVEGQFQGGYINRIPVSGVIKLKYEDSLVKEISDYRDEWLDKGYEFDSGNIYTKIFLPFYSTLIHELQHAYDFYRSGGKYANYKASRDYYKMKHDVRDIEKIYDADGKLSEEQIKRISDIGKRYLRLRHEVDARFAEAIRKTNFYDVDFLDDIEDGDVYMKHTMKPFKKVKSDFIYNMSGISVLSTEERKRVLRKLGQFYQLAKDDIKKEDEKFRK